MEKIIIGLVGEIAAGKSTATDYLKEKHNAVSFRFSDMLRDIADRLYIDKSRHNLQTLSTFFRQNFGDDIMSKVIAKDVENSINNFIITEGVRRPTDVTYLKELPGFKLIAIKTDEKTRFDRLSQRSENPDDQTKTWDQFQLDSQQEAEQEIKTIMSHADEIIDNNGGLEDLHTQLDELVKKYQSESIQINAI